ncbi:MAG: HAD-IA family hydrolase [Patescibacteria group bacterium]
MNSLIKAVLFDYNGVIVDDLGACGRAECDVIHSLGGQKLSISYWFKNIHQDWQKFYMAHGVPRKNLRQTHKLTAKYYHKYEKYIKLTPDVKLILQRLTERNIKLGILSAASRDIVKEGLRRFGLANYFSFIIGGDDVAKQKPHPQGLSKAVRLFKVKPQEVMYVDDMPSIFVAAKKMGVKTVGFYSRVSGDLSLAEVRIRDIRSLLKYIK